MKFNKLTSLIFLFFVAMCIISTHVYAETKIAVVDVEAILTNSKAAQSIKKQVDQKRKKFLSSVKEEENKLRKEQKAIEEKREQLSKEELRKKAQEFEKRRLEARKLLQKKKAKLDKSYSLAMNKLTNAISEVCQELAHEKKIDLIITRQNIIIGNNSLDITSEVMALMDKKIPELKLN